MADADTGSDFDEVLAEEIEEYDRLFGIVADGVVGAAGGLAGVAAMTGVLFIASQLGVFDFAKFTSLGRPLGVDSSVGIGFAIFLVNGMVPWPLLFAAIMEYLPGNRPPVSGLVFGTALWTGFVIAFYGGYGGIDLWLYLGLTLAAHWAYGGVLGAVFEYLATRPDSLV